MYNQLNLSQMGCFDTSLYHQDKNVHEIYVILSESDVEMMEEFSDVRNQKNYDLLKRIAEENEIVSQRLKQKIDELCLKRNKGDPLQIAVGKCGNPCYAYQLNLFFNCPKCNGNVKRNMENGYTTERIYDDYSQSVRNAKIYNESNICTKFDFNENIDKCDVDSDECIKFFEKIDELKTVHWSFDIQTKENNEWVKKEIEKDMPIHYMMLDGERFDFPYGITMRDFFKLNNDKFFKPRQDPMGFMASYQFQQFSSSNNKGLIHGEYCEMFYERNRSEWGQSCGCYGFRWLHKVYIYECEDCGYKYHIIKTSPFHCRDKSKDPK